MSAGRARHAARAPWAEGVLKGCTGLVLGLLVFALLELARGGPLVGPYVGVLRASGIDAGMRMASHIADPPPRAASPGTAAADRLRYVFLDLDIRGMDEARCRALLSGEPEACGPNAAPSRTAAAAALAAAREAGARVVVVDLGLRWPGPPEDPLLPVLRGAAGGGEVPVVLPLMTRATRGDPLPLPGISGPPGLPAGANVHFALPLAFADPHGLPDRVVRSFARSMAVQSAEEPPWRWTVAGLAACLAAAPASACATPPTPEPPRRQVFTLPRLSDLPGGDPAHPDPRLVRAEIARLLLHVPLSEALEWRDGRFALDLDPAALRNAVVVIGARDDWRDEHLTPLGAMSGAEVMLNGIRALAEFDPLPDELDRHGLLTELANIGVAAVLFGLFWAGWTALRPRIRPGWLSPFIGVALFGCVAALAVGWTVAFATFGAASHRGHYDVIMPVLGTSLETLIDGMKVAIEWIEGRLAAAGALLWRLLAALWRLLVAPWR